MPAALELDVAVEAEAEGARRATGASGSTATSRAADPDPEVPAKVTRRRFSAEYRLRILKLADGCKKPGDVGALLRREGLYSSHLTHWRQQRERGALAGMRARKRIAGMRDRLTHHCFGIDLDLVWRVAERDLSPLRDAVGELLSGMSAGATRPTKNRLSSIWSARARERKI